MQARLDFEKEDLLTISRRIRAEHEAERKEKMRADQAKQARIDAEFDKLRAAAIHDLRTTSPSDSPRMDNVIPIF